MLRKLFMYPHRYAITGLMVFLCLIMSYFYLAFYNRIEEVHQEETRNTIMELKKTFLKNTVDNIIQEIEINRKIGAERYKDLDKEYIDNMVKEEIAEKIRNLRFDNDSYIWINEVLSYEGGDDYAIRRVHPNLPHTEGMYLSTNITDIKGNYPYLTELEGIKKDGEIFFQYYFKEFGSDEISEKFSYAKLYKEYDWIIAMGVQVKEIDHYILQSNERVSKIASSWVWLLMIVLITIVVLTLLLIILIEKQRFKGIKRGLEKEINIDSLTNAHSRKFGTKELLRAFDEYKTDVSPAIMILDIDKFKNVNDNYGHEVGDWLLKEVVAAAYKVLRSTDTLVRWGGDEFLGIFHGLKEENAIIFGNKILNEISSIEMIVNDKIIDITGSIGITYFRKTDESFSDAIKRADEAMYKSKDEGRNRVNVL